MCDMAPVAHRAWGNSYLVTHIGDINHCFDIVISAVEDPRWWHEGQALTCCQCVCWSDPLPSKGSVLIVQIRSLRTPHL